MNVQMDLVASALAGTCVLLASLGYWYVLQRRRLESRLAVFVGGQPAPVVRSATARLQRPHWSMSRLLPLGVSARDLSEAGLVLSQRRFLFMQLALGLLGVLLSGLAAYRLGVVGAGLVVALATGAVVGLAAPHVMVRLKRRARLGKFEKQLADALDSLANAVEVGLSLPQSLETVGRDMPAPLGPEFGQVVRSLGMGLPLSEALDQLAARVPLRDVEIFVTAVQIQYRTGGALTGVLRTIASTVRQRVNLRSEIRSMTAQQRYSAYVISALPVLLAVAVKFLSPTYFDMLLTPGTMRLLLVAAGCGIVCGFFFMMRIADIEV